MSETLPLPAGCVPACPGCRHRAWPYAESLGQKQAYLARALAPWAERLEPVSGMDEASRWGYRRKLKLAAAWAAEAGWRFGLEPRGEFLAITGCPAQTGQANAVLAVLARSLPPAASFPLRYVVMSGSLCVLVLKTAVEPARDWLDAGVEAELASAGLAGLLLNLHPAAGRILYAKRGWRRLWGEARVKDELGLMHGAGGFLQQIPALYRASLDAAEAFLAPRAGEAVLDLYCGLGASLHRWRSRGAHALGLDCEPEALACAAENAPGAELLRGLGAQRLPQLKAWAAAQPGGILAYVNPPRLGVEAEVLAWLAEEARPERLAYLSCSAGTLARDLLRLTAAGYGVEVLKPYDFFPNTPHVETLALLSL
ncbi:MAG: class I SAM-dependent RNA methyltransferase [Gammaproteobacteria bacterium]|nr:class I SAM-dependent RNA methyltransferase [Gammaproteobacteria bacterium]